jgi:hypothetical protein
MSKSIDDLLARAVPKLAQSGEEKLRSLRTKLARFAARAWTKGRSKLVALGVPVRESVHTTALGAAEASEDDDEGAFLEDVRKAFKDDDAFVEFLGKLTRAYSAFVKKKKEADAPKKRASSSRLKAVSSGRHRALKTVSSGRHRALKKDDEPRKSRSSRRAKIADDAPPAKAPSSEELPTLEIPEDEDETDAPPKKPLGIRFDAPDASPRADASSVADDGEIAIELLKPAAAPTPAAAAPVAESKDEGPDAAAARAVERYKKDGDREELAQAKKLFKVALEAAEPGPARAAARAGVALACLLGGQDEDAAKHARKALEEDACCALGISVAAKAARGDGVREKLKAAVARARAALKSGNASRVAAEASALEKDFPEEPFAALVTILAAVEGNRPFDEHVAAAWKRYPSTLAPELIFGAGLDALLAKAIASWATQEIDRGGPDALIKTQRNLDQKENVLAGAFQLALGIARTAFAARFDYSKVEEQELRAAAADGLLGLQYYDAAAAAFDKAQAIDRQSHAAMECKKGAERANVLRRAFDKPGVKAKMGAFEGVAVAAVRKMLATRMEKALAERQKDEAVLLKDEVAAVKVLAEDAPRRATVIKRARAAEQENPLEALMAIEEGLDGLTATKKDLDEKKTLDTSAKKGFFGRAFDKVKDTAKGAELAVRQKVLEGKRDEAFRAVARALRDAPSSGWGDKVLDALAERGRSVNARIDFIEDEVKQANKVLARLGEI